jgi:hypothetical protein
MNKCREITLKGFNCKFKAFQEFGYCKIHIKKHLNCSSNKNENIEITKQKLEEQVIINFKPLFEDGVMICESPKDIYKNLVNFHKQQIEFIDPCTPNVIMGGFGAYGNPTSFHHPEIRQIRKIVYNYLFPSFQTHFKGKNIEMLLDRFAKRAKGTQPTAESWHRDVTDSKIKLDDDNIYGGWINLDPPGSDPQSFSCVPGTHKDKHTNKGFARIDKNDIDEYKNRKKVYSIPPGHMIMFNQDIIHEVFPKKSKFDSYRLFCGWRVTSGYEPLYDNSLVFEEQGIPRLGGGMLPPMYYSTHWMYPKLRQNLFNFSNNIRPEFKEEKELKSKKTVYNVVQRYMKSLKESGLQLWPSYSKEEIDIHHPQKL